MAWVTGVQSQVESYQRLKKWYLIPPCLTLSIIRYISRVKWSNLGKRVAPSPTPRCSSYWKGSFRVALVNGHQLYFFIIMSCYQHGYPWPSLATPPYHSLLPVGLQGYILYQHRAAVCRFELVVLPLVVHVNGSTGVHHLWTLLFTY